MMMMIIIIIVIITIMNIMIIVMVVVVMMMMMMFTMMMVMTVMVMMMEMMVNNTEERHRQGLQPTPPTAVAGGDGDARDCKNPRLNHADPKPNLAEPEPEPGPGPAGETKPEQSNLALHIASVSVWGCANAWAVAKLQCQPC
eukprot:3090997-Rhodomonas_salina.2